MYGRIINSKRAFKGPSGGWSKVGVELVEGGLRCCRGLNDYLYSAPMFFI